MKKLIFSLILVSLICSAPALAQTQDDEIRLLIARAPVVEAMDKAQENDGLVVWYWLMALAYTGHTEEAFEVATELREWRDEDDTNSATALGLAIAGKTDEAISLSRHIKDPCFHKEFIEILAKARRSSETMNEGHKAENGSEREKNIQAMAWADSLENKAAFDQEDGNDVVDQTTVKGLLKVGKIDDALSLAQNIKNEDDRSEAFAEAAVFLLRSGSYQQARLTADRCPSPVARMFLYYKMLNEISFKRNPQLRAQLKNHGVRPLL
jgi:hypothetical protein